MSSISICLTLLSTLPGQLNPCPPFNKKRRRGAVPYREVGTGSASSCRRHPGTKKQAGQKKEGQIKTAAPDRDRRPVYRPAASQLFQPSCEEGASALRGNMRAGGMAPSERCRATRQAPARWAMSRSA